ncbi:methyltransferase domain-containing protein [bacterium]|nr:methyltransferase domain-containing protein [bacterium]
MRSFLLNPEVRPVWDGSDETALLAAYEQVWERKRILRRLYETWYSRLGAHLRPGPVVEIGAGTGNFRRWVVAQGRPCLTLDILPGRSVDVRADALLLPLRPRAVSNLVLIDGLHHFAQPFAFLAEAARVLRPGGRLLLLEPFVSAWGWLVYRYLHHERVETAQARALAAAWITGHPPDGAADKTAWDGNAAIPKAVLDAGHRAALPLRVVHISYSDFLAYPLSGGFSYRALLPEAVLGMLHRLEHTPLTENRVLSLRVFAVLEQSADPG